jgi:hypothetical protein
MLSVDALDASQCEPERLDAYVGFSRSRVAATSPRQDLGARRHARGISQRLVGCAAEKRAGVPLGIVRSG